MGRRTIGGSVVAVATDVGGREGHRPGGLDGALDALRTLGAPAPACCTWACCAVVGAVRDRRGAAGGTDDAEFEAVLVRRFADRYLRVAGAGTGGPVPGVWRLLLDPPRRRPELLAVAGVGALLRYDLTLAAVGACTVLGRTPGARERDAHRRVAALLGDCGRELARVDGPAGATAARLDSPAVRDAAWRRVEYLWALRGWPAEAEDARVALDRDVRAEALDLLSFPD